MKGLNDQILELSRLVESGRLSEKEFISLRAKLVEESGVGMYSAESPLPPSRIPMKQEVNVPKSSYNNGGIRQEKEKPSLNEAMIYIGFKSLMGLSWLYIAFYLISIVLLLAIAFGWEPWKEDIPSSYNPSWGYSYTSPTEFMRSVKEGK